MAGMDLWTDSACRSSDPGASVSDRPCEPDRGMEGGKVMLNTSLVLFGIFIILLICNIPIAVSLGIASIVSIVVTGLPIEMFPHQCIFGIQQVFVTGDSVFYRGRQHYGEGGNIRRSLIDFAKACVGHRKMGSRWCA